MTTQKKETNWQIWKAATIVLAALLLLVCCLTAFSGKSAAPAPASEPETAAELAAAEESDETPVVANDSSILSSWAEDSKAREELVAFVEAAVDENSAGFIPVANRIAESGIFDLTDAIGDRKFNTASGILADLLDQRAGHQHVVVGADAA